jgi:hypothetical protein
VAAFPPRNGFPQEIPTCVGRETRILLSLQNQRNLKVLRKHAMDTLEYTKEQIEQKVAEVEEAMSGSDTVSTSAWLAGGGVYAGGIMIFNSVKQDVTYISATIGGLGTAAIEDGGKLKIKTSVNRSGYTGSCSLFIFHILGGYTNVIGYDSDSKPVFWFNGGGVGLGMFAVAPVF